MSTRFIMTGTLVCVASLAICLAQSRTAEIVGRVIDPSGGAVIGARVMVRNIDTDARRTLETKESGDYVAPLLEPGNYEMVIEQAGFSTLQRSGIVLHVDDSVRIDITLQLGAIAETVNVVEEAPLLRTTDASIGQVIDNTKIIGLPLNGRSSFRLVELTPGFTPSQGANGQFGDIPVNTVWDANFSINGGQGYANEIHIDGAPSTAGFFNQITTMPSVDSLVEFKVQSNNLSAEFGRFGGGVLNVTTKSGTNDFRGSLFEFLRNSKLDANDFFNNRSGAKKPPFHMNQFGGSVGGPVIVPAVYNGKNRSFFFLNFEATRWRKGDVYLVTVPSAAQRAGDFSGTLTANGQLVQIFDPTTTRPNAAQSGSYVRDPFPRNVIPASRINSVGKNIVSYFPQPNLPGAAVTGLNNYLSNAGRGVDKNQLNVRIDHQVSQNQRIFGRISSDITDLCQPDYYGNVATPGAGSVGCTTFKNRSAAFEHSYTYSPTVLFTVRYGFARWYQIRAGRGYGFDQSTLGFPASYVSQLQVPVFPTINLNGYNGLGNQGNNYLSNGNDTHSLLPGVTIVRGRQEIKAGSDLRLNRINIFNPRYGNGTYNFTQAFTQGPDPTRSSANAGDSVAALLLGYPTSGTLTIDPGVSMQNYYYSFYVQDNIKLSTRLTLNAGLRYEAETPFNERRNQLVGFDPTLKNPASNTSFPNLTGALFYSSADNRTVYKTDKNNIAPRLGLAFQAAPSTVIRAGAGLFYAPLQISNNAVGFYPTIGYSSTTAMVTSTDGGLTPFATLSNPIPNVIAPTGKSLGAATGLGQDLTVWSNNLIQPQSVQWNVDIQRQLPKSILIDVAYVGNRGIHLGGARSLNALPTQFLSQGTALLQTVRNPFYGSITAGNMAQQNVIASRLLRPYPQYENITFINDSWGNSIYHALQFKLEKRLTAGFSFLASYTAGKLITDVPWATAAVGPNNGSGTYQNWYNLRAERSLSAEDISQSLTISYNYELPFGNGRFVGANWRGPAQWFLGGWQINGLSKFQTGTPLGVSTATNNTNSLGGGSRPNNNGTSAKLSGDRSTNDQIAQWFNTSVFSQPAPFTYGNTSRTLADVRAPGAINFDLSVFKNIALKERFKIQFRTEFFNLLNHANMNIPSTALGARDFGMISSTALLPRVGQFALKLTF